MGDAAIYIEAIYQHDELYLMTLESFIIVSIFKICQFNKNATIKLNVKKLIEQAVVNTSDLIFSVDLNQVDYNSIDDLGDSPTCVTYCKWPILIILQDQYVVAGLCSVARQLLRSSSTEAVRKLLGFRNACLMACSESSVWTKFCEVDMISTIKKVHVNPLNYFDLITKQLVLPVDICRLEFHLGQPVRMHNVNKMAAKQLTAVHHTFSEGPFMTLADIILFPCIDLFLQHFPSALDQLPLVSAWFEAVQQQNTLIISSAGINITNNYDNYQMFDKIDRIIEPEFLKQSLYTSDPARYRPEKRIYTKQKDIANSLQMIDQIQILNDSFPYGQEIPFDWSLVCADANPICSGALPAKRAHRKCEQLENLAKAVIKMIKQHSNNDSQNKIVDFCSGSGHLGILLAHLLPDCEIILVENKEHSMSRARDRIRKMRIDNVVMLQTNLDYFVGAFHVGVALHACGVATDLVMQRCIETRAHFVCCPCCYGGVHDCDHLTYPRSAQFRARLPDYKDYVILAHAADQTHDKDNGKTTQGFVCMDVVDTDRRLYAESCGYRVHLGKLQPTSCTHKNNLLVGVCLSC